MDIATNSNKIGKKEKKIISVGGGKGGVGKTCFAANIGISLALKGKKVVLVDADIEGANLHTFVGINYPQKSLDDYINFKVKNIEEIILSTPVPHLRLISSCGSMFSLSGLNYSQRRRLIGAVCHIDADIVIFDISAGSRMRVIDYFSIARFMVIIIEPSPTVLENAYGFLNNLVYRHLLRIFYTDRTSHQMIVDYFKEKRGPMEGFLEDLLGRLESVSHEKTGMFWSFINSLDNIYLVVNKVGSEEKKELADRFARMVKRYLMINLKYGGYLPSEPRIDESVKKRLPFVMYYPHSNYTNAMNEIVMNLFL